MGSSPLRPIFWNFLLAAIPVYCRYLKTDVLHVSL